MRWLDMRSDLLADRGDPADVIAELVAVDALSVKQRESLDYALGYWVLEALQRPNDADSLVLLDKLATFAQQRSAGDAQFSARLAALRDLLENKRLSLAKRRNQPSRQLLHAQAILDHLQGGKSVRQVDLAQELEVSPGRVSQILAVMEQDGLITRERRGQESWVSPAGEPNNNQPPQNRPAPPQTADSSAKLQRGVEVFLDRQAA